MAGRTPEKERWKPPEMEDALHYFAEYARSTPQHVVQLLDRLRSADVNESRSSEAGLELLAQRVRVRAKIIRLGLAAKYLALAESMTRKPTLSAQDAALSARMLAKEDRNDGTQKREESRKTFTTHRIVPSTDDSD